MTASTRSSSTLRLSTVLLLVVSMGCGRPTTPKTLRSGEVVGILNAGHSDDWYLVDYCSRGPYDRNALRPEVAEILTAFSAETSRSAEVHITPTDCRLQVMWAGWRPVLVSESGTSFHFVREAGGAWKAQD